MAVTARKKRKIPEVLWRLFRDEARTLADSIVCLVTSSPSAVKCFCNGQGACIGCTAAGDAMAFLLRPHDPSDYRSLLTRCFVFVSHDAPPLAKFPMPPARIWSQYEIITRAIGLLRLMQPENVLCSGYNQFGKTTTAIEPLTTTAWKLLLERIGDGAMAYLLKHCSIFLPLTSKRHHQVAGPPIIDVYAKNCKRALEFECQYRSEKWKIPEVLLRLFRDAARTLADSIVFLVTSSLSAVKCFCNGQGACIGCTAAGDAMAFLLRPHDPSDYCRLLSHCFVFVSHDAPPLSKFPMPPARIWSQYEIVARAIGLLRLMQPENVLCSGYNQFGKTTTTIEPLTTTAWKLLLERIGDGVMAYLLKHCSIFLPLTSKRHHQVAGPPIIDVHAKNCKRAPEFECQYRSVLWKRRRNSESPMDKMAPMTSQVAEESCDPITSVVCNGSHSCHIGKRCRKRYRKIEFLNEMETASANKKRIMNAELHLGSDHATTKSRKRFRPYSWQRHKKTRLLNFDEASVEKAYTKFSSYASDADHKKASWRCCCFMLRAPRKVVSANQIDRHPIFYNLECTLSDFPQSHVLYSLKPNLAGASTLIKDMFGLTDVIAQGIPCYHSGGLYSGSSCLYHSFRKFFKILIRQAQYCRHSGLLDKHCRSPFPSEEKVDGNKNSLIKGKEAGEAYTNQAKFSTSYCSHRQVVSFIWAVCRSIVPDDLLGSPSNWRILRRNISKFIQLRRFEKFSLKQCMHQLRASEFPFFANKHSSCDTKRVGDFAFQPSAEHRSCGNPHGSVKILKQELLECWIFWLFSCLVVPLVRANFYVTESEDGEKNVYYYRKSIWQELSCQALSSLMGQSYSLVDAACVTKIVRKRPFGFSQLRLRPKGDKVRALVNLKAPSRYVKDQSGNIKGYPKIYKPSGYLKSVNYFLRDIHTVIKGLWMKEPEKVGSSVFDHDDVYKKLCPFVIGLKKQFSGLPDIFIVVADVLRAFDSVNQDMLLSILKDIIVEDQYRLMKSQQVICTERLMSVKENITLYGENSSGCVSARSAGAHALHSIHVNQGCSEFSKTKDLYFYLKEHVKRNILQLDTKFYLQNVGIPQGSILSTLLCSFYYGHLDRNVIFPFLKKVYGSTANSEGHQGASANSNTNNEATSMPQYLLLRFIDDFLLISSSKRQASSFFYRLQRGFRDYNCYMNETKLSINFSTNQWSKFSSKIFVGQDGISYLRWSGLLINCCTLEVQADYSRFLNNHIRSTLTVCWRGKPLSLLKKRLCDFVGPKTHPIYYDSNINSAAVVRLNIYQANLLCAMKFHGYVSELPAKYSVHAEAYCASIIGSFRYMHKLIKKRMLALGRGSDFRPVLQLKKGEVEWLGLNAYISVLKRKQSRHKELLILLRSYLAGHDKARTISSPLMYAVDASHSSIFWKMKY